MSPNVADAAARVPFDAAQYTWIDVSDAPALTKEEKTKLLEEAGVPLDIPITFKSIPFPFQQFAIILPQFLVDPGTALTFDLEENKLTILGWHIALKLNTFSMTLDAREGAGDRLEIKCHPKLSIYKEGPDAIRLQYSKLLRDILGVIICFSAGIYGRQRAAYRCTANPANPKRMRKGKTPLYDWKTIVVETVRKVAPTQGGTHASPRQHDVRGHWVRGKSKTYWRKAHKRGDPSKGVIFHDYVTERIAA